MNEWIAADKEGRFPDLSLKLNLMDGWGALMKTRELLVSLWPGGSPSDKGPKGSRNPSSH